MSYWGKQTLIMPSQHNLKLHWGSFVLKILNSIHVLSNKFNMQILFSLFRSICHTWPWTVMVVSCEKLIIKYPNWRGRLVSFLLLLSLPSEKAALFLSFFLHPMLELVQRISQNHKLDYLHFWQLLDLDISKCALFLRFLHGSWERLLFRGSKEGWDLLVTEMMIVLLPPKIML